MRWLRKIIARGFITEYMNGTYVRRESCHIAVKSMNQRIDDFREHVDQRFDDLKEAVKNNGKLD